MHSNSVNNSVNQGIFYFMGARIWAPTPVYRYENRFGYVTVALCIEYKNTIKFTKINFSKLLTQC